MGERGEIFSCPPESVALVGETNGERQKAIEDEGKAVQQRLRDELQQLWTEDTLFQRLMYKNKNQHRRCLYFRRLTQVQKDLKLLKSLGLDGIVESSSLYLPSSGPADDVNSAHTLTTSQLKILKAMLRSLLGAARLLEQMVEAVLKASQEIAGLLGSAFFMPFALTNFSCLARFRVLILQITPLPSILECSWKGDCLRLSEKKLVLPPMEDPVQTGQESETPSHPIIQWVVDDRSGKMIDLKRKDLFGETPCLPSDVPPEALEGGEPCEEGGEDTDVPINEGADSQMDAVNLEENPSQVHNVPETSDPYIEGDVNIEPEGKRDVTEESVSPACASKRKGSGPGDVEPDKRVAYVAVRPSPDSRSEVTRQATALPPRSDGHSSNTQITDSDNKSKRMRTDEFFDMLLGRTGKKSLF